MPSVRPQTRKEIPPMSARLNNAQPYALGLFRIVVGLLFACHGAASLFGVLGGAIGTTAAPSTRGTWPGWYAAVIQLVGGVLVLLGLGTRAAAFIAPARWRTRTSTIHQPRRPVADPERRRGLRDVLLGVPAARLHRLRRPRPGPAFAKRSASQTTARPSETTQTPVAA